MTELGERGINLSGVTIKDIVYVGVLDKRVGKCHRLSGRICGVAVKGLDFFFRPLDRNCAITRTQSAMVNSSIQTGICDANFMGVLWQRREGCSTLQAPV